MKGKEKFTCHDCDRKVEEVPNVVLRRDSWATISRVKVCARCQYGIQPVKRGAK